MNDTWTYKLKINSYNLVTYVWQYGDCPHAPRVLLWHFTSNSEQEILGTLTEAGKSLKGIKQTKYK